MRIQWNKLGLSTKEKPANSNGLLYRNGCVYAAYFCPNCGSEIYGAWNYLLCDNPKRINEPYAKHAVDAAMKEYRQLQTEAEDFSKLSVCPYCGDKLAHTEGYFIQNEPVLMNPINFFVNPLCRNGATAFGNGFVCVPLYSLDDVCRHLEKLRTEVDDKTAAVLAEQFLVQADLEGHSNTNDAEIEKIKSSPEELKKYLSELVRLEANILAISKRLPDLYRKQIDAKRDANVKKYTTPYQIRQEIASAARDVSLMSNALKRIKDEPLPIVSLWKPQRPSAPVLQTSNFFNKKRIAAENQKAQADYDVAVEKYMMQIRECEEKEIQLRKKNEQDKLHRIQIAETKLSDAQKAYDVLSVSMQDRMDRALADVPKNEILNSIEEEIALAEKLLKELFDARNALYACNIVYSKYRNFIAIATFCEYLITGRCTTLEGADGAYNLYETECRAKTIISRLSQIVDSIDRLKETQYMVWEELNNVHKEVAQLNSLMIAATSTVADQLQVISSSGKLVAYNTAVAAYYTKVSADLAGSTKYIRLICR